MMTDHLHGVYPATFRKQMGFVRKFVHLRYI